MTNDVDLFQPLHEKIETVRRYGKDAEQLTVRIPSELRKDLKRLAKKKRIKEGAMHRALLEWAIEIYAQSSRRPEVSGGQVVDSDEEITAEQIALLSGELVKVREQLTAGFEVDRCETCPIRDEITALRKCYQSLVGR